MRNNEKGITLVALVVTIIVLLILAGITISVALNNGGILGRAEKAKQETEAASIRDYVSMAIMNIKTEYYTSPSSFVEINQTGKASAKKFLTDELSTGYTFTGDIKITIATGEVVEDSLLVTAPSGTKYEVTLSPLEVKVKTGI